MSKTSDNRNYIYKTRSKTDRQEFKVIEKIIGKNKKIIDLGCGDGSLMQILETNGNKCKGIELSQSGVTVSKDKGLNVTLGRIDEKLPYKDKAFDFAICNVTLQMVMYPEVLLGEMKRISKKQIITFPNFAFILNRIELMFFGVFPRWSLFGYKWYSTGHIHQLSVNDFNSYCKDNRIKISNIKHIGPIQLLAKLSPNLFATMAIFETE